MRGQLQYVLVLVDEDEDAEAFARETENAFGYPAAPVTVWLHRDVRTPGGSPQPCLTCLGDDEAAQRLRIWRQWDETNEGEVPR